MNKKLTKEKFFKNFPYNDIRKEQKYILNKIYDNYNKYKYFVIEAPTGTGKSAIAKTLMDYNEYNMLLTSTKFLQNQYENEFNDLFSIKGKSSYICKYDPTKTCDEAPCKINFALQHDCMKFDNCEYYRKLNKINTFKERSFVTSYAFYFTHHKQMFVNLNQTKLNNSRFDMLILDECHLLENNLISNVGFKIDIQALNNKYNILKNLDFQYLVKLTAPLKCGYKENEEFLLILNKILSNKIEELNKSNENLQMLEVDKLILHDMIEQLNKLYKKLVSFLNDADKYNWVVEPNENILYVQPINIGNYFNDKFEHYFDKYVFLSGTILDIDKFVNDIGINPNEVLKIKVPSTFDSKRSPIVYLPSGKMNYKSIDASLPNVINNIKNILQQYPNEKGIIHTNNYKITKEIVNKINNNRLIYCKDNMTNEQLMELHVKSTNSVIISPSLYMGADLKDELSRFQIIIKMPFLSLADRRVNKKSKIDNQWYINEMFKSFIQMCGRSIRSKDDYCVTYVLDSSFYYYIRKNIKLFNKKFLEKIILNNDDFNLTKYKNYIKEIINE